MIVIINSLFHVGVLNYSRLINQLMNRREKLLAQSIDTKYLLAKTLVRSEFEGPMILGAS